MIDRAGSRGGAIALKNSKILKEDQNYRKLAVVTACDAVSFEPIHPIPDEKFNFEQTWKKFCEKSFNF